MTFGILRDFPGLENGLPEFHDFPWPGDTLNLVLQKHYWVNWNTR